MYLQQARGSLANLALLAPMVMLRLLVLCQDPYVCSNVRVIDIACGDHHSAALTDEGKFLSGA